MSTLIVKFRQTDAKFNVVAMIPYRNDYATLEANARSVVSRARAALHTQRLTLSGAFISNAREKFWQ